VNRTSAIVPNGQHQGRHSDLEEGVRIRWFGSCRVEVGPETVVVVVPWKTADVDKQRALAYASKYAHDTDAEIFMNPEGCDIYLFANVEALSAATSQTA